MTESPRAALDRFMAEYTPEVQALARGALAKLGKLLPSAVQLVYDNYNALVVAFSASAAPRDIVCSIALYPRWITMFFLHGATLPDPAKLLAGSGKTIRGVVLRSDALLDERPLRELIEHATAHAPSMKKRASSERLVIQSISPKRRPRRPAGPKASATAKPAGGAPSARKPSRAKTGAPLHARPTAKQASKTAKRTAAKVGNARSSKPAPKPRTPRR